MFGTLLIFRAEQLNYSALLFIYSQAFQTNKEKGVAVAQHSIGQLQFNGTVSSCCNDLKNSTSVEYKDVKTGDSSLTAATGFKDAAIVLDGEFVKGNDYYLKVQIPQNFNYDYEFTIKLMKENGDYQFLKKVSVPKPALSSTDTSMVYEAVLYETNEKEVTVTLQEKCPTYPQTTYEEDVLYYQAAENGNPAAYYLGQADGTCIKTNNFNDMSLTASWMNTSAQTYGTFEMTFSPVEENFTYILLEMTRSAIDYNIQYTEDADGNGIFNDTGYGRKITITQDDYTLYELVNLVTVEKGFSRIGVWGHPGLMMAINNEEIQIGPSGYYEQDVLTVTSLGIKVEGWQDTWTLDYEYENQRLLKRR